MKTEQPPQEQPKDSQPILSPKFNLKTFPSEVKAHLEKAKESKPTTPHNELLAELLNQLEPVDFLAVANCDRVTELHYQVITIDQLLNTAKVKRWEMCNNNGKLYLYNGAFWNEIKKEQLEFFLGEVACRFGVDKHKAQGFQFKEKLLKQFQSSAVLKHPEPAPELVLFNLQNGTFEVNAATGERRLRKFQAADFLTYQLPFSYDESAQAPQFQQYLDKVLPEPELQQVLAEFLGWVFVRHSSGILKLEKVLVLYGGGANGKSVFHDIVTALLGPPNVTTASLEALCDPKGFGTSILADKLLNYCSELSTKLNTALFKQLASGEPVRAERKYQDAFEMRDYAKLIFNTNSLPKETEQTKGFFRKWLIVPFRVEIPQSQRDTQLAKKIIKTELAGVFNWALRGLERLLEQQQFSDCAACVQELEQFKKESDSVAQWIEDSGYRPSNSAHQPQEKVYLEYSNYCSESGFHRVTKPNHRKRLEALGFEIKRHGLGNVVYLEKPPAF